MKIITGILLCCPLLAWAIFRIYFAIGFSIDCGGHIKRAADASTIDLAIKEMETVIKYCEKHDLTTGIVSIFLKQPKNDIGFWYNNLKSSLEELKKVDTNTTQLEKTNILMKLRETLTDQGESVSVTGPNGISIYPHNVAYFWWVIIGLVLACIGCIFVIKYVIKYIDEL